MYSVDSMAYNSPIIFLLYTFSTCISVALYRCPILRVTTYFAFEHGFYSARILCYNLEYLQPSFLLLISLSVLWTIDPPPPWSMLMLFFPFLYYKWHFHAYCVFKKCAFTSILKYQSIHGLSFLYFGNHEHIETAYHVVLTNDLATILFNHF